MRKELAVFLLIPAFIIPSIKESPVYASSDPDDLWERFLKYDLCITDYNELTDEEQELCRFIFDTEQAANDDIICERARRTLSGEKNIGSRITLEQLEGASGIWDNYLEELVYGDQTYIHCVPDVIHFGTESDSTQWRIEYWLDDDRSKYVIFNQRVDDEYIKSFDVFDNNDELIETIPISALDSSYIDLRDDEEYGYIEKNDGYYYIKENGTAVFAWCKFSDGAHINPIIDEAYADPIADPFTVESEINGCPVTAIENCAFVNSPLTEIILPDSIEVIDFQAFANCAYLEKINLPKNLKHLGTGAFRYCNSLSSITIDCPDLKLQRDVLKSCQNLKSIELNVYEIGEYCLPKSLESLKLGNDLKKIDINAFSACDKLVNIEIPSGTEIISQGAFVYSSIDSVTIPPTVRLIGAYPRKTGETFTFGMQPPPPRRPLTDEPVCAFNNDCVIKGYKGTEAERYAKEWGLEFVPLEAETGDVNLDGEINISDAVALQRFLLGKYVSTGAYYGDMNEDSSVDVFDLVFLKKILLDAGLSN